MKKFLQTIRIVFLTFLIFSLENCSKETEVETPIIDTSGTNQDADDVAISLEGDLQVSDYIWQGLNYFYYWQTGVPELADSKLNDEKTYAEFINQNPDPVVFFRSLKHEEDRFSVLSEDYDEFNLLIFVCLVSVFDLVVDQAQIQSLEYPQVYSDLNQLHRIPLINHRTDSLQ